jgi:hypothetical protein
MNKPEILVKSDNYTCNLHRDANGLPTAITVDTHHSRQNVIRFGMDAPDMMGFCDLSGLKRLAENNRREAVTLLGKALREHFGGKNMFVVPQSAVSLMKEAGFDTTPRYPNGKEYSMLMSADPAAIRQQLEQFPRRSLFDGKFTRGDYTLTSDPAVLSHPAMAKKLSRLYLENAEYAWRDGKKELYTARALQERIRHQQVHTCAYLDRKTRNPVACVRTYIEPGIGAYTSDLVAVKDNRKALGFHLMEAAARTVPEPERIPKLFVIAGSQKEARLYRNHLGFEPVMERTTPLPVGENIFMFGMFPQQKILLELPAKLAHFAVEHPPSSLVR